MQQSKPIKLACIQLNDWGDFPHVTTFWFEDGMTWEEYFNSKYSQNLKGYVEFNGMSGEHKDFIDMDYDEMVSYGCTPSISYELDENDNIVLEFTSLYTNCTPFVYIPGFSVVTYKASDDDSCRTGMKLTDKMPTNVMILSAGGWPDKWDDETMGPIN